MNGITGNATSLIHVVVGQGNKQGIIGLKNRVSFSATRVASTQGTEDQSAFLVE